MSASLTATPDESHSPSPTPSQTRAIVAERLLRWLAIGGLVLGTFGTFHAVSCLVLNASPNGRAFHSATLNSLHRLAVITVIASQVMQMVGSVALWRRRLLGRTLLLAYATLYLGGLVLLQVMYAVDHAGMYSPAPASQRALIAVSQLHLVVYGSIFPMFLVAVLSRPWVTRLLRRKGEPVPAVEQSAVTADPSSTAVEQRRAA
ncbi:MAG TPA: hypothetical protein VFB66_00735 [Tepidisphaeraceae bacterium]|nr:hypothetical protein [Tepidisphaeraceae bacterium]